MTYDLKVNYEASCFPREIGSNWSTFESASQPHNHAAERCSNLCTEQQKRTRDEDSAQQNIIGHGKSVSVPVSVPRRKCFQERLVWEGHLRRKCFEVRFVWEGCILRRKPESIWVGSASLEKREATSDPPQRPKEKGKQKSGTLLTGWAFELIDKYVLCPGHRVFTVPQLQLMLDSLPSKASQF